MMPRLMHRDRAFSLAHAPPWNSQALTQDLELNSLLHAMACDDEFLLDVSRAALLSSQHEDVDTVLYRQAALRDCLKHPEVVRELYELAVEAGDAVSRRWLGIVSRNPSGVLHEAVKLLRMLVGMLREVRRLADRQTAGFRSEAFRTLFSMIQDELSDDYLARVNAYVSDMEFRRGMLLSAGLGRGNAGEDYVLRKPSGDGLGVLRWLAKMREPRYSFRIHPRDEGSTRTLAELRGVGVDSVANVLAQSADHILAFFQLLRTELAFYLGCHNLHRKLTAQGEPVCFPEPHPPGTRVCRFTGLYDVCLSLHTGRRVVGSSVNADGKNIVIITGANQGGKSVFLRSVGLAQMMMHCGMFVGAESFAAELCTGLYTHYKREEDANMELGKLSEELDRMSAIVDHLRPNSLLLCNESFAATNEREGSEIARHVVLGLRERGIRVILVTHLYEFAHAIYDGDVPDALCLRAERLADGTRTFRIVENPPLATSFGRDLWEDVFSHRVV